MDKLMKWNKESILPNTLMTIYQKKEIDIEALRWEDGVVAKENLGEFDLLWVLSNISTDYLKMKKISFSTTGQGFKFTVKDEESETTVEMTNFLVEVQR